MPISSKGLDFVVRHEGFVSRAYRDQGGVWTIGTGFTNRSAVAARMIGPIGAGKTITRNQNDRVLAEAFATEYGPPVDGAMPGGRQHERDAGYSYSFNAGPAAMGDAWVGLWRQGQKTEAGERLKVTRVTAQGKPSRGLRNRRAAEARLLVAGDYGTGAPAATRETPVAPGEPDTVLMDYQQKLLELGYDAGEVDGWHGPKTKAAVLAFQKHHPNLVDDGILGPATRAQIDRDVAARKEGHGVGGVVVTGIGFAAWLAANGHVLAIVAGLAVVAIAAVFALRRREEITHWIKDRKG